MKKLYILLDPKKSNNKIKMLRPLQKIFSRLAYRKNFSTEPLGIAGFDRRLYFKKHGISFYDKHHDIFLDDYIQSRVLSQEKSHFKEFQNNFNQASYEASLDKTLNRGDVRQGDHPERLGPYLYYSKIKPWNQTTITT